MADTGLPFKFLLGTVGHNQHIGNIALALHERGALESFYTGGVDVFKSPAGRIMRKLGSAVYPDLDERLSRRRVPGVSADRIQTSWGWESLRLAARYMGFGVGPVDWVWERGELALDRRCSQLLLDDRFNAYFGVEHGALGSLRTARALGKKSVLAFLSPHHATRAEWVDPLYEHHPELLTRAIRKIRELAKARDARRDEEACTADVVHCASNFTAQSLIRAGLVTSDRLTIVPLGCPEVEHLEGVIPSAKGPVKFVWSGTVALHKGIHFLLEAWKRLRPGSSAELHLYGSISIPVGLLGGGSANVVFHGPVNSSEMNQAYRSSDVLVFPTLCDGFGMVVPEAFAHGLPVITTHNAGSADLVAEGRNGFVVPARDAERLAERLEWCIDHPEELRAMRTAARETALQWTWNDFRSSLRKQLGERLGIAIGPQEEILAAGGKKLPD